MTTFNESFVESLKGKTMSNIRVSEILELFSETEKTLKDTLSATKNLNVEDITDFALWNHSWNEYGIYGAKKNTKRNTPASHPYRKGKVLMFDLGHHGIGNELAFPHMGIVLRDFKGLLVIVPVTSDRSQYYNDETKEAIIRIKRAEHSFLSNDSIALVHQIRCVGRNRIIGIKGNVNNTPLMLEIERRVSQLYSPKFFSTTKEDIFDMVMKIKEKDLEIENLKQTIETLRNQISQAAPTSDNPI